MTAADAGPPAASQDPIRHRNNRIEMRTRHRAEHEYQSRQPQRGGRGVLKELQTDVIW